MCYYYLNKQPCICGERVLAQACRRALFRLSQESSPMPTIRPCGIVEPAWGRPTLECQKCKIFLAKMAGETTTEPTNELNDFDRILMALPQSSSTEMARRDKPWRGQIEGRVGPTDIPVQTIDPNTEPQYSPDAHCIPHLDEGTGEIKLNGELISMIPPRTAISIPRKKRKCRKDKAPEVPNIHLDSSSNDLSQIPRRQHTRKTPADRHLIGESSPVVPGSKPPSWNLNQEIPLSAEVRNLPRYVSSTLRHSVGSTTNQDGANDLTNPSTKSQVSTSTPNVKVSTVPGTNASDSNFAQLQSPTIFTNFNLPLSQGPSSQTDHDLTGMANSASSEMNPHLFIPNSYINPSSFPMAAMGWDPNFMQTQLVTNPTTAFSFLANSYAVTPTTPQNDQSIMTPKQQGNSSFLRANRFPNRGY